MIGFFIYSLRVQPCANNGMGGWLDSVGCGNSNPRIQRCRIFVGWTGACRVWGDTYRTVPLGLLPIIIQNESGGTSWAGQVTWVKCTNPCRVYNLID